MAIDEPGTYPVIRQKYVATSNDKLKKDPNIFIYQSQRRTRGLLFFMRCAVEGYIRDILLKTRRTPKCETSKLMSSLVVTANSIWSCNYKREIKVRYY